MHWLNLLGIAVGLAMDAFAVAVATGLALDSVTPRHVFRLAFHFGLFQFFMPILGWLAGGPIATWLGGLDHWLAFGLLALVGGKMLWEAWHDDPGQTKSDPTRGLSLVTLSVATSLDALAVGLSMRLSMAPSGVSILGPSVVIGLVAASLTAIGLVFGARIGQRWGHWAEVAGGGVLLAIGLEILLSHVLG